MRGKYEPIPAGYSRALHLCVSRLLVVDPARRASVHEVRAATAARPIVSARGRWRRLGPLACAGSLLRRAPPRVTSPATWQVLCSDEVVKRMSELPTHPGPHDSPGVQMVDLVQTIQARCARDTPEARPRCSRDPPHPRAATTGAASLQRPHEEPTALAVRYAARHPLGAVDRRPAWRRFGEQPGGWTPRRARHVGAEPGDGGRGGGGERRHTCEKQQRRRGHRPPA